MKPYQRITDPGYHTGKVRIGVIAPMRPRRMTDDEIEMQSILLGRCKPSRLLQALSFVFRFTR